MLDSATAHSLRQLFTDYLLHFARSNSNVSEPPSSLEESLLHGAREGAAAPFHFALLPEIVRFKTLERSFSSALGAAFEDAAAIVGATRFRVARRQHPVTGRVRATVIQQIDQILKDYETLYERGRIRTPDIAVERALLRDLHGPGGDDFTEIIDLYLEGADGSEHYFHMKTVKPNRDQSNKAKRLMLRVYALRLPAEANVFFGMAYNPYGEGNPYRWSFPKPYFDFEKEVLIGGAFWDYIGGSGTFRQVVELAMGCGRDLHDQILRELGLP